MKILVVRFSSIGDIVLTTPVLRGLKEQLDNAEIHYLTKAKFANILDGNPHIDKVYTIDKSIDEVISKLKLEQYDHIVDLHHNLRTQGLKKKLKRPLVAFQKLNWKKWLLVKFKINRMPDVHVVDRYFGAVKSLGVVNDNAPGIYRIPTNDEVDVEQVFGLTPGKYIAIAIGAQFATKKMPEHLLLQIIENLHEPVILVGGETDVALAESVIQGTSKEVHDACGKYSLAGSASIVQQSRKLLTNDTGMMHIAACFDIPIVSVWGNTVPALGMYPYRPNDPSSYSTHEVENLGCRPCSKIGFQQCPKGHFKCMQSHDIQSIVTDLQ